MAKEYFLSSLNLQEANQFSEKPFYYEISSQNEIQYLPMLNVSKLEDIQRISHDDQNDIYKASYIIGHSSIPVVIRKTKQENVSKKLKRLIIKASQKSFRMLSRNYGCYQNSTQFCYATQYMNQGNLEQFISFHSQKKMPKLKQSILSQICFKIIKGIEELHQLGVESSFLLCPQNIGLNSKGELKLLNLEINQSIDRQIRKSDFYLSPEQILGQQYSQACFSWSLGIILLQLATNQENFPQIGTSKGKSWENLKKEQSPMSQIITALRLNINQRFERSGKKVERSEKFNDFISQCLQKDQKDRPKIRQLLTHPWIIMNSQGNQLTEFLKFISRIKQKI